MQLAKPSLQTSFSEASNEDMLPTAYVDAPTMKSLFSKIVSCGPISCLKQFLLRSSQQNRRSFEKGSLGRDMPYDGDLTWQAASAVLGLASLPSIS
jgi:hypothetical protein